MRIIEWSSEVCSSDLTQFANAGGWLVSDRAKQQRQLRVVERRRSNQQLEHDGTERIQVAGRTERFACDVLGRHVQRRAEHTLPTLRTGAPGRIDFGDRKIHQLGYAVTRQHDIAGLDKIGRAQAELQSLMRIPYAVFS